MDVVSRPVPGTISDAELLGLVRTGALRTLRLGAHQSDLAAWLGEPEDDDRETPRLRRLGYRGRQIQVGLLDQRVASFGLYFRYGGSPLAHPGFSSETTRADVERWLDTRHVRRAHRAPHDVARLVLDHGVQFVFDGELLDSIQVG